MNGECSICGAPVWRSECAEWCEPIRRWLIAEAARLGGQSGLTTYTVDGCDRPHHARGMCTTHYSRWHRNGGSEQIEQTDALGRSVGSTPSRPRLPQTAVEVDAGRDGLLVRIA